MTIAKTHHELIASTTKIQKKQQLRYNIHLTDTAVARSVFTAQVEFTVKLVGDTFGGELCVYVVVGVASKLQLTIVHARPRVDTLGLMLVLYDGGTEIVLLGEPYVQNFTVK